MYNFIYVYYAYIYIIIYCKSNYFGLSIYICCKHKSGSKIVSEGSIIIREEVGGCRKQYR